MKRVVWLPLLCSFLAAASRGADAPPKPLVAGLKAPRAVAPRPSGKAYRAAGDSVLTPQDGKATPSAGGLGEPRGIATFADAVFVADKNRVWRIDRGGKRVLAAATAFPAP